MFQRSGGNLFLPSSNENKLDHMANKKNQQNSTGMSFDFSQNLPQKMHELNVCKTGGAKIKKKSAASFVSAVTACIPPKKTIVRYKKQNKKALQNTTKAAIVSNCAEDIRHSKKSGTLTNLRSRLRSTNSVSSSNNNDKFDLLLEQIPDKDRGTTGNKLKSNDDTAMPQPQSLEVIVEEDKRILPSKIICKLPLERLSGILKSILVDNSTVNTHSTELLDLPPTVVDEEYDHSSQPRKSLCLYCDKKFSSQKLRIKHTERVHAKFEGRRLSARNLTSCSPVLSFPGCSYCNNGSTKSKTTIISDLTTLFYHLIDFHSDKYFACKPCGMRLPTFEILQQHNNVKHEEKQDNTFKGSKILNQKPETAGNSLISVSDSYCGTNSAGKGTIERLQDFANIENENQEEISRPENTPTKTRRQLKQACENKLLSPGCPSILRSDEAILSRLGVAQNRLPRGRKGLRNRRILNTELGKLEIKTRSKVGRINVSNVIESVEMPMRSSISNRIDTVGGAFENDFYENVCVNVRKNLNFYLDGKLETDSCPPYHVLPVPAVRSTIVRSGVFHDTEIHEATTLQEATATFPTLLTAEQYGSDLVSNSKIKKPITKNSWKWKWDCVKKYKYVNEGGKIIKKVKQPMGGLRDLSKLDMWTQLTMRTKHETAASSAATNVYSNENEMSQSEILSIGLAVKEEKRRQIVELDRILDTRRLPQIVLEQSEQTVIKIEVSESSATTTTTTTTSSYIKQSAFCNSSDNSSLEEYEEIPFHKMLHLHPRNYKSRIEKDTIVLSGEWARPRSYICFGCGAKFDKLKTIEEHKMFRHPYVLSTHYEIVGRELIEGDLYKNFFIPAKALNRFNKKTVISRSSPGKNVFDENDVCEESSDSTTTIFASTTTISKSDCDTECKNDVANSFSSVDVTEKPQMQFSSNCTKCNRECNGILDLYRHILECSNDYVWMIAKKRRYRYYAGSRRRRHHNRHRKTVKCSPKLQQNERERNLKTFVPVPRPPRPSDAESIRRMLENLPAKRVCRQIIPDITKPRVRKFQTKGGKKTKVNLYNISSTTVAAIGQNIREKRRRFLTRKLQQSVVKARNKCIQETGDDETVDKSSSNKLPNVKDVTDSSSSSSNKKINESEKILYSKSGLKFKNSARHVVNQLTKKLKPSGKAKLVKKTTGMVIKGAKKMYSASTSTNTVSIVPLITNDAKLIKKKQTKLNKFLKAIKRQSPRNINSKKLIVAKEETNLNADLNINESLPSTTTTTEHININNENTKIPDNSNSRTAKLTTSPSSKKTSPKRKDHCSNNNNTKLKKSTIDLSSPPPNDFENDPKIVSKKIDEKHEDNDKIDNNQNTEKNVPVCENIEIESNIKPDVVVPETKFLLPISSPPPPPPTDNVKKDEVVDLSKKLPPKGQTITNKKLGKKLNECIAKLAGKLQEKLGKPFLESNLLVESSKPENSNITPEEEFSKSTDLINLNEQIVSAAPPCSTNDKPSSPPKSNLKKTSNIVVNKRKALGKSIYISESSKIQVDKPPTKLSNENTEMINADLNNKIASSADDTPPPPALKNIAKGTKLLEECNVKLHKIIGRKKTKEKNEKNIKKQEEMNIIKISSAEKKEQEKEEEEDVQKPDVVAIPDTMSTQTNVSNVLTEILHATSAADTDNIEAICLSRQTSNTNVNLLHQDDNTLIDKNNLTSKMNLDQSIPPNINSAAIKKIDIKNTSPSILKDSLPDEKDISITENIFETEKTNKTKSKITKKKGKKNFGITKLLKRKVVSNKQNLVSQPILTEETTSAEKSTPEKEVVSSSIITSSIAKTSIATSSISTSKIVTSSISTSSISTSSIATSSIVQNAVSSQEIEDSVSSTTNLKQKSKLPNRNFKKRNTKKKNTVIPNNEESSLLVESSIQQTTQMPNYSRNTRSKMFSDDSMKTTEEPPLPPPPPPPPPPSPPPSAPCKEILNVKAKLKTTKYTRKSKSKQDPNSDVLVKDDNKISPRTRTRNKSLASSENIANTDNDLLQLNDLSQSIAPENEISIPLLTTASSSCSNIIINNSPTPPIINEESNIQSSPIILMKNKNGKSGQKNKTAVKSIIKNNEIEDIVASFLDDDDNDGECLDDLIPLKSLPSEGPTRLIDAEAILIRNSVDDQDECHKHDEAVQNKICDSEQDLREKMDDTNNVVKGNKKGKTRSSVAENEVNSNTQIHEDSSKNVTLEKQVEKTDIELNGSNNETRKVSVSKITEEIVHPAEKSSITTSVSESDQTPNLESNVIIEKNNEDLVNHENIVNPITKKRRRRKRQLEPKTVDKVEESNNLPKVVPISTTLEKSVVLKKDVSSVVSVKSKFPDSDLKNNETETEKLGTRCKTKESNKDIGNRKKEDEDSKINSFKLKKVENIETTTATAPIVNQNIPTETKIGSGLKLFSNSNSGTTNVFKSSFENIKMLKEFGYMISKDDVRIPSLSVGGSTDNSSSIDSQAIKLMENARKCYDSNDKRKNLNSHRRLKKKVNRKKEKNCETENINDLQSGLESFSINKTNSISNQMMSSEIPDSFPSASKTTKITDSKTGDKNLSQNTKFPQAFGRDLIKQQADITSANFTSELRKSILRPSILSATLEKTKPCGTSITTESVQLVKSSKKSISSRDPRLNKELFSTQTDDHDELDDVVVPKKCDSISHRRKSEMDISLTGKTPFMKNSRTARRAASQSRAGYADLSGEVELMNDIGNNEFYDDDNSLAEIAKSVNDRIKCTDYEEFNDAQDGFNTVSNQLLNQSLGSVGGQNSTFENDKSNGEIIFDDENTNTELIDMDLEDDISVYTSFSQDVKSLNTKGKLYQRRKRRKSILATRKPKKLIVDPNQPEEVYECTICNKNFRTAGSLSKHQTTLTHIAKLSEYEYLNASQKANEVLVVPETAAPSETEIPNKELTGAVENDTPLQHIEQTKSSEQNDNCNENVLPSIEKETIVDLNVSKTTHHQPIDNNILSQAGIEPISSPEQNDTNYRYHHNASSRVALSQEERLFYECCNMLKGSETPMVERNYPVMSNTYRNYLNLNESVGASNVREQSINNIESTTNKGLTTAHSESTPYPAYPKIDMNQFSDISSDSNTAFSRPPPQLNLQPDLPFNYAKSSVYNKQSETLENIPATPSTSIQDYQKLCLNVENSDKQKKIQYTSNDRGSELMTDNFFNMNPNKQPNEECTPSQELLSDVIPDRNCANLIHPQPFTSPLHSVSSQGSTTTLSRMRTKAAMKGYDNFKISIPTTGLDIQQVLERSPHGSCKLTALAEIALGSEAPSVDNRFQHYVMTEKDEFDDSYKVCEKFTKKYDDLVVCDNEHNMIVVSDKTKGDTNNASSVNSNTRNSRKLLVEEVREQKTHEKPKDIYEFDDSEESNLRDTSGLIKCQISNTQNQQIPIPDRPFKDIGLEKKPSIKFYKPDYCSKDNDENVNIPNNCLERDDFDQSSINENIEKDQDIDQSCSDSETCSSMQTTKTIEAKCLIMGRIFKNATKNCLVKKKELTDFEHRKNIPEKEMNKMFDNLRKPDEYAVDESEKNVIVPDKQNANKKSQQTTKSNNKSKKIQEVDKGPISSSRLKQKSINTKALNKKVQQDKNIVDNNVDIESVSMTTKVDDDIKIEEKKKSNKIKKSKPNRESEQHPREIIKLQCDLGMTSEEFAKLIGGQRKSQRRCATSSQRKFVEIWSSDEYEEFLSTKDIIALIEEQEKKNKRKRSRSINNKNSEKKDQDIGETKNNVNDDRRDEKESYKVENSLIDDSNKLKNKEEEDEEELDDEKEVLVKSSPNEKVENTRKTLHTERNVKSKINTDNKKTPYVRLDQKPKPCKNNVKKKKKATAIKQDENKKKLTMTAAAAAVAADSESSERDIQKGTPNKPHTSKHFKINKKKRKPIAASSSSTTRTTITAVCETKQKKTLKTKGIKKSTKVKKKQQKPVKNLKKSHTSQSGGTNEGDSSSIRPLARRKRVASEMLYYWSSSSSDEEFGLVETRDDDDLLQDGEHYQQHGWIVGDSHKKLVTLLAIAKGKNVEECGVKEKNSKKK